MPLVETPPPGLRDRKRTQTSSSIEAAAVFLVLRDGLEQATVEAISDRANVSARTFFNYFDSKDAAVLGLQRRDIAEDILPAHLTDAAAAEDVVTVVVRLVLAFMGAPTGTAGTVHRDRLRIIRRHPEIVSSQFAQLSARRSTITELVARLLAAHPDFADDPDPAARAGLVLALCGSAACAAVHEWADHADASTDDHIERRAVELVTSTLGRLR